MFGVKTKQRRRQLKASLQKIRICVFLSRYMYAIGSVTEEGALDRTSLGGWEFH